MTFVPKFDHANTTNKISERRPQLANMRTSDSCIALYYVHVRNYHIIIILLLICFLLLWFVIFHFTAVPLYPSDHLSLGLWRNSADLQFAVYLISFLHSLLLSFQFYMFSRIFIWLEWCEFVIMIKFCMQSIRCIVLITKSVDCALQIVVVTVRVELSWVKV